MCGVWDAPFVPSRIAVRPVLEICDRRLQVRRTFKAILACCVALLLACVVMRHWRTADAAKFAQKSERRSTTRHVQAFSRRTAGRLFDQSPSPHALKILLPDCSFGPRRMFMRERHGVPTEVQPEYEQLLVRVAGEVQAAFRDLPRGIQPNVADSIQEVMTEAWSRVPPMQRPKVLAALIAGERGEGPPWIYDLLFRLQDAQGQFFAEIQLLMGDEAAAELWRTGVIGSCELEVSAGQT